MRQGRQPEVGLERRACAQCGTEFQPYRSHQIACSRSCRERTRDQSPRIADRQLTCRRCGVEFITAWSGMGCQPSCNDCRSELARANQERKNAARRKGGHLNEKQREYSRRYGFKRYKLTEQEFDSLLVGQDGVCGLCGARHVPGERAMARLHIDHDHITGQVRKLLCHNCNRGLGGFRDNPALMRAAAEYVEHYRRETP